MAANLTLVRPDDEDEDAYALRFGHYVLSLLRTIEYGHVEVSKHAGALHKIRRFDDMKVPDDLKRHTA